jgi:hypothetical protein
MPVPFSVSWPPRLRFCSVDIDTQDAILLRNTCFRCPTKAVKAFLHDDASESNLCQQRDKLCLRQSAGDSTGPEIDVPSNRFR